MTAPLQAGSACYLYGISERRVSIAILALCTISSRNCYNLCHPEQRTAQHAVATIDVQELLHVCRSRSRQSSTSMCRQWHRRLDLDSKGSEQHGRHMQDKISLNKVCKTAWAEGLWDEVPGVWSSRPRLGYSGRRKMSTTSDLRERGPGGEGGSRRG